MKPKLAMVIVMLSISCALLGQTSSVEISHATTAGGDLPGLALRNGASLTILIFDTDTTCFEYSLNGTIAQPAETAQVAMTLGGGAATDRVTLATTHRERVLKYAIHAANGRGQRAPAVALILLTKRGTCQFSLSGTWLFLAHSCSTA